MIAEQRLHDHPLHADPPPVNQPHLPKAELLWASPREIFNLDWITLAVIFVIAVVGAAYFLLQRPDRRVSGHVHDELEATGAERVQVATETAP